MTATQPAAPPLPAAAGDDDLRLVLFGLPAAGKSSLLGALGQAAKTQEHLLGGKLDDRSHHLTELGRQVYDDVTRQTAEEVVPYPVRYEPLPELKSLFPARDAVLLDCDGKAANEILRRRKSLEQDSPEGTLAFEMTDADAVILALDASAKPARVEEEFAEFAQFLESMQAARGARAEVAGLPVFLVLTKCDLVAQPGDNAGAWMERIEQRKREVGDRFKAFLAEEQTARQGRPDAPEKKESPFGRVELHVWATAIKRPALAGSAAKPREPYGVAELFRQAIAEASVYRARYDRSQRKLMRLVVGAVGLVALMLLTAATMFVVNANTRLAALKMRVEDFRFLDQGGPAEYLRGGPEQLKAKRARLEEVRDDPLFGRLSADDQGFVTGRIEELNAYVPYLETMLSLRPLSAEQSEEGLDRALDRLRNELAVPRAEWADTLAGQIHKERVEGIEALRRAVQAVRNWYLDAADQAGRLWTFGDYTDPGGIDWADWAAKAERAVDPERRPPFREGDEVPGVPGGVVTFSSVYRYDRVLDARAAWGSQRDRLGRLLNITSALGLAPATKARPAALVFTRDITLAGCKLRLEELKTAYPDFESTFTRDSLPDLVQPRVRQSARRQYEVLLGPARAEVLRRLRQGGKGEETTARWEPIRAWLKNPEELAAWRVLARALQKLDDPALTEPVEALAAFLAKAEFPIDVRTVTVEIPEARGLRPRAESRLVVLHPASERQPALAFEPAGEPARDPARRLVRYSFRLAEGQRLTYHPGDKLWAELPLTGGKERLVWAQSRSGLYQFERLVNPPRLQSASAATLDEGRLLDDVRLTPRPEDGVPAVPDLVPWVRLDGSD
ncbi:MAG: GTPase domain-containing protein [Gemmataceae bacterium]